MTGTVFLVVAVFVAGLLYLVLRRRGSRRSDDNAEGTATTPAVRRASSAAHEATPPRGIRTPPISRPDYNPQDSGSSHPAYPVAPAKYAEYTPKNGAGARREPAKGDSGGFRAVQPKMATSVAVTPPAAAEEKAPWYPEAPASYGEGQEIDAAGDQGSDPAGDARHGL